MKQITKEQRYQMEAYLKSGMSKTFIAEELSLHVSSIYREVKRNAQKRGGYSAKHAQQLSDERKDRFSYPRKFNISIKSRVRSLIENEQWSPKQIVGDSKKKTIPIVSHERIYQYVREDKANGGDLYKNMRHRLKHRKRPVGEKKICIKTGYQLTKGLM